METSKMKILIVDDDAFLIDMYALKFTQNNFEVSTAFNGKEAIEKLQKGLIPNIILLDIMMPEMDGFQMMQKMSEGNIAPTAIKIVLSNKGQQEDIDTGLKLGASGYIIKASNTPAEVVAQVLEIVNKK
ncbi:MAG: response regulator transcription factor [Patescibacteria group bacterium]